MKVDILNYWLDQTYGPVTVRVPMDSLYTLVATWGSSGDTFIVAQARFDPEQTPEERAEILRNTATLCEMARNNPKGDNDD